MIVITLTTLVLNSNHSERIYSEQSQIPQSTSTPPTWNHISHEHVASTDYPECTSRSAPELLASSFLLQVLEPCNDTLP